MGARRTMKKPYSPPLLETFRISCSHQMLGSSNEGFPVNNNPLFPSSSSLFNGADIFNGADSFMSDFSSLHNL